ncbi:hypothetical protein [Legionella saoudiensis]|uniref:hypothetical protein n=1 Tax=Legionella saoudiensis TaxID=1750561 RepID=UPI00072FE9B4|nr:hypothetical protein [Legionella saoudiensis]
MKKFIGLMTLSLVNGAALYLIFLYVAIACSTNPDNFFGFSYEPSGTQLLYYLFSLPFFVLLVIINGIQSYYFSINKWLSYVLIGIWIMYFLLLEFVDKVLHFTNWNELFYWGSLSISLMAIILIVYISYLQVKQLLSQPS